MRLKLQQVLNVPGEVAALLAALHLQKPDLGKLKAHVDDDWRRLLGFSDIALDACLGDAAHGRPPGWVVERLQRNLADNSRRFERVKNTYREVKDALSGAGATHIVIKGFTQAPDYIGDARLRSQSDIDLFCQPEDIALAQAALESIGHVPENRGHSRSADHGPNLVRRDDWQWRGNHFDPDMPLSIELHFCLWNEQVSLVPARETALFWERRTTRQVEDLAFPGLNTVDQLGYFALHIVRNVFLRDWVVHHARELGILSMRVRTTIFSGVAGAKLILPT